MAESGGNVLTMRPCAAGLAIAGGAPVVAQQYDAPFLSGQQRFADQWAEDGRLVDQRLAALRQRFGAT